MINVSNAKLNKVDTMLKKITQFTSKIQLTLHQNNNPFLITKTKSLTHKVHEHQ